MYAEWESNLTELCHKTRDVRLVAIVEMTGESLPPGDRDVDIFLVNSKALYPLFVMV